MYVCMYVCLFVCVCVCVYMFFHEHMYTPNAAAYFEGGVVCDAGQKMSTDKGMTKDMLTLSLLCKA